jgi:hypothetical protein
MSIQNYKRQLLASGNIVQKLHYGPFAVSWWVFLKTQNKQNEQTCIPIRVNLRVKFELNQKEFIIRVVDNNWKPGYVCESDTEAIIYSTSSAAINETYKKNFVVRTRFSGPSVLGFENEIIAEQLQAEVLFFPFQIITQGIAIFVAALGSSDQAELNFAGPGYRSSFFHKYRGQHSLIYQSIMNTECRIDIYHQEKKVQTYTGKSPSDVWTKPNILKNYDGKDLFGLCNQLVIQTIQTYINTPYCKLGNWNDIQIMTYAFEKCLKRRISVVNLNWYLFFTKWKQQSTTIIEFTSHIASIYPKDFEITNTILGAWRSMMRYVGCTNITPYKKKESNVSFCFF